jgi:hypothetical protein
MVAIEWSQLTPAYVLHFPHTVTANRIGGEGQLKQQG